MTPRFKSFLLCVVLIFGLFALSRVNNNPISPSFSKGNSEEEKEPCDCDCGPFVGQQQTQGGGGLVEKEEGGGDHHDRFGPSKVLQSSARDLVFKLPEKPFSPVFTTFTIGGTSFFASDDGPIGVAKYLEEDPGEIAVAKVLSMVLPKGCKEGGIFLDIGANSGIYGLYAAKLGCSTYFFDLQPTCHMAIQSSLLINNLGSRGFVIPRGVNHIPIKIKVSSSSNCHGQFMLSSSNRFETYSKTYYSGATWQETETLIVDKVFKEDTKIFALKIDTEGAEYGVLKSMWKLLEKGSIRHLIVEVTPNWWEDFGVTKKMFLDDISKLWDFGYKHIVMLKTSSKWETIKSRQAFIDLLTTASFPQVNFYISQDPLP